MLTLLSRFLKVGLDVAFELTLEVFAVYRDVIMTIANIALQL